jgi:phosphoribosylformimino-5-aminoimidazole carboxamide ribotide isomerase
MIAIPALDIGMSSPLSREGRMRAASAAVTARDLIDLGFSYLHVQSGTGAAASTSLPELEEVVRDSHARVQVGRVASTSDIEQLLRAGADAIVVGDRALEEPDWLAHVVDLYPDTIAVATDVRDRRVARRGWVRTLPVDILDLVDELNTLPLRELIVNIRPLDAAMRFEELSLLEDVADRSRCPVFAAGGITSINDLRALEHRGLAGAVIEAEKLLGGAIDGREVARDFGT